MLFAYFSAGLIAKSIWNQINTSTALTNESEYITCQVDQFHLTDRTDESSRILFFFQYETEAVYARRDFLKKYVDKNPDDYLIELKVKKGIWNYYVLEDWNLLEN